MKSFHDLIFSRRSIRKYTDNEIPAEFLKEIIEAALVAPSSKSKTPWQFVLVENKDRLLELGKCKDFGAKPIENCAVAVVVTADATQTDTWIEDASIAAMLIQLQAHDLGIGSCWIQIRERYREDGVAAESYIKQLLGIPDEMRVLCIITLGHINEIRKPYDPEKCKWEKVHIEHWGKEK